MSSRVEVVAEELRGERGFAISRERPQSGQAHRPVGYLQRRCSEKPPPAATPPRMLRALAAACAKPANWVQLVKFSMVGASGYVVNLAVFAALVKGLRRPLHPGGRARLLRRGHQQLPAGTGTGPSRPTDGHAGFQAARFLTVSLLALGFNLIVLEVLVSVGGRGEDPRPGDRDPRRHAAQLRRQQALELRPSRRAAVARA